MEGRSHMHFIFKQTKHNLLTFSFFRTISNSLHIKFPKKLSHFIPHLISLFHFLHGDKNVGKKNPFLTLYQILLQCSCLSFK